MIPRNDIVPVFLGADLNCYNFARAFHQAYGLRSYAFGRYKISATKYSRIIKFKVVPDIDNEEKMLEVLGEFAKKKTFKGKKLYLFGCTDDYAAMIIRRKNELPDCYVAPSPSPELYGSIQKKAEFYEMCDKFNIPYPATVVLTATPKAEDVTAEKLGFDYPIIVKPSSSVDYWKHSFEGMKKVYVAKDPDETVSIVKEIYDSGYPEKMILQKMVPGGDSNMRVLTAFSDKNGKVRAMCLGHTLVEEHTPKGLGNHAAIVTEPTSDFLIAKKIKAMLEACNYTGFSNFDIKEDGNGNFYVFEINLRQGRSNMYVTACGLNIAMLAVDKWDDDGDDCVMNDNEWFWHHVPRSVAYEYTEDKELAEKARGLAEAGSFTCSLLYSPDTNFNFLRSICVYEQLKRQKKKFATYYPKKAEISDKDSEGNS